MMDGARGLSAGARFALARQLAARCVVLMAYVLVGYGVAVATQWLVFPLFGLHATLQENLLIGLIFTAVSLVRSYVLRRAFEALRVRQLSGNSG